MKKPQAKPEIKPTAAKSAPARGHEVELEIVAALARIAGEHDLSELVVERAGLHVRVARGPKHVVMAPAMQSPAPLAAAPLPQGHMLGAEAAPPKEPPGTVKSPMVGTAYLRPSPEAKPFIEVGQTVKEGDKVLLVEAMKTFNEILAPRSGAITHIFIEDGTPVEYGQPLLAIA
jgi:acetyl-CoA carboxylase biotin carboxyl carrier protein